MPEWTKSKIWKSLSAQHILPAPLHKKEKLARWSTGFFLPPFIHLIVLIARSGRASLLPILFGIAIGVGWYLLLLFAHKPISQERYNDLPPKEQKERLIYDSFWHYLWITGSGVYCIAVLFWGIFEIGIAKGQSIAAAVILVLDVIVFVLCLLNWRRIAIVTIVGYENHETARKVLNIVLGFYVITLILPSVTSIVQVTTSVETDNPFILPVMIFVNLFPLVIYFLSLQGAMITIAHYKHLSPR